MCVCVCIYSTHTYWCVCVYMSEVFGVVTGGFLYVQLMTSDAVLRWESSVQEGILDMTRLLVELVAERLKHPTVPHQLLEITTNVSSGGESCMSRGGVGWC